MVFENIKTIDVKNKSSWRSKLFLTFDVDWCSDEVLSYTLDIIEKYDINATFFITHQTILLDRMRENPKIELGIHPNFNPLLSGDFQYGGNINKVIEFYKKIVPEAVSVRSHSLTQSSNILDVFSHFGLKYDCNHFVPYSSNIDLKPWDHWDGKLIKIPYFWEDDVHCIYGWDWHEDFLNNGGIKVFDFHPIHIYLNTEQLDRYEKSREFHSCSEKLSKYVYDGYGTHNFLIDLINKGIK